MAPIFFLCAALLCSCHSWFNLFSVLLFRLQKAKASSLWCFSAVIDSVLLVAGAGLSGRQMHRTQAVFNHTEDYVLLPDERTISLCCWDSRTAERKNLLSLGHNNIVRCIVHSPTNPGFMTCSDDFRARFWYRRTTTDWTRRDSPLYFIFLRRDCTLSPERRQEVGPSCRGNLSSTPSFISGEAA